MTIDEAIKHCEEVAEEQEKLCKVNDDFNFSQPKWRKCAKEHRQLAEWLKELKSLKAEEEQEPILDKIRAEIIELAEGWNGMQAKNVPLGAVLKIIDKHTSGKKE